MDYHSRSRQPIRPAVAALAGTSPVEASAQLISAPLGDLPGEYGQEDQPPSSAAHCALGYSIAVVNR